MLRLKYWKFRAIRFGHRGRTHSQCPVHAEVQRNQDEVVEKEVDSLGPTLHRRVSSHLDSSSSSAQLGEEEGAERVNL